MYKSMLFVIVMLLSSVASAEWYDWAYGDAPIVLSDVCPEEEWSYEHWYYDWD